MESAYPLVTESNDCCGAADSVSRPDIDPPDKGNAVVIC